jgi:hypothetical protein
VTLSRLRFSALGERGQSRLSLGLTAVRRLMTGGAAAGAMTSLLAHYPLAMEDHPAVASHRRAALLEKGLALSSPADSVRGGLEEGQHPRRHSTDRPLETSHELYLVSWLCASDWR